MKEAQGGSQEVTDKRKGRDLPTPLKRGVWEELGSLLWTLLFSFHMLACRHLATGLGQEAVHGSHCNGISGRAGGKPLVPRGALDSTQKPWSLEPAVTGPSEPHPRGTQGAGGVFKEGVCLQRLSLQKSLRKKREAE